MNQADEDGGVGDDDNYNDDEYDKLKGMELRIAKRKRQCGSGNDSGQHTMDNDIFDDRLTTDAEARSQHIHQSPRCQGGNDDAMSARRRQQPQATVVQSAKQERTRAGMGDRYAESIRKGR